jgi:hypothetical protein
VADLFSELLLVHSVVGPAQSVMPRAPGAPPPTCAWPGEQCVSRCPPSASRMRRAVSATSIPPSNANEGLALTLG